MNEGVKRRGFASMSPERRKELASKGGHSNKGKRKNSLWTPEQADAAREKGLVTRRSKKVKP